MINKSGDVEKTCILHGLGAGLDDEAVHVVRQWKYQPYLLNGEPVEIGTTITMRFGMR
jgi:protein TonB